MAKTTTSMVVPADPAHRLDEGRLLSYLQTHVKGFLPPPASLQLSQFGHGQPNPTYLLQVELDGVVQRYVLRKKPRGHILQSAHAIEHEHQVLSALGEGKIKVPVPRVYCLCTDSTVIGTPFYVMEHLDGRLFVNPNLPGMDPKERRAIYGAMAKVLAAIHLADVDAIGLSRYGRKENYCKRQVERWAAQYHLSTGKGKPDPDPNMLELIQWLRENIPIEDATAGSRTGIVHGDFRLDNLVFHPTEARVIGVLDWELSTLGNQMSDAAYNCLPYVVKNNESPGKNYGFDEPLADGIPALQEYLAEYCDAAGVPWPANTWNFYIALSLFRYGAICAGVYLQLLQGNASGGKQAEDSGPMALFCAATALRLVKQGPILPRQPPHSVSVAGCVVALGKFEGLHLGHRALAERASALGKPIMLSLSGMAEVFGWEPKLPVVASIDRARVLESWAKHCHDVIPEEHVLEFAKIRKLSPEQFVEKLANELKVNGAVAGSDYRFGFRAAGKSADLVELCKKYGLQSAIVEPVMDLEDSSAIDGCSKDKGKVSTTHIRKALAEGDVKQAAKLLGRNHRLYIEVKGYVQNECVIGFPTANVLNQPPTVGSYECGLYLEGTNDNYLAELQVRIQETEISLELQDSSLVNKITHESRIALDFLS